jgi:putative transcriptional regulator
MALTPAAGRLLVATPGLLDPNFARTVVLLLAHSDEGALGVVLNRPGSLPVDEVLPHWSHLAAEPGMVFIGGPVQPDTALCLGETNGGWRTVDVDEDPALADVDRIRLYAAYAGWSAEQLEMEIDAGGWYVLEAKPTDMFTSEPDELWRQVLRRQGGRIAWASTAPADPRHN